MSAASSPPSLETPRLILRPFALDDADDVFAYSAEEYEEIRAVLPDFPQITPGDTAAVLRHTLKRYGGGEFYDWAVTCRELGTRAIGGIGFEQDVPPRAKTAELGFVLRRDMWGKGIIPEAIEAVVSFGFAALGLAEVAAYHMPGNEQSARALEKCSFRHTGREEHFGVVMERWARAK